MRKLACLIGGVVMALSMSAKAELIEVQSENDFQQTVTKLKSAIEVEGMTIFATVDHAAAAQKVDLFLAPNTMVMFGNPKVGTKLMQCDAQVGIELPLKMLVTQDLNHKVWVTYENPEALAKRFDLSKCQSTLSKVADVLQSLASVAGKSE